MNLYVMFLIYLYTAMSVMGSSTFLISFLWLEVLSWLFIVMAALSDNNIAMKYLFVQSIFLMLMVAGLFFHEFLLFLGFLLKLGFPPFHNWVLMVIKDLSNYLLSFFLTFHKILPIMISSVLMHSNSCLFLLLLTSIMLPSLSSLSSLLIFSSLVHTIWMFSSLFLNMIYMLVYWISYTMLIYLLILFSLTETMQLNENQNLSSSIFWYALSGIPPFIMFWLKVIIVKSMFFSSEYLSAFLIVLSIMVIFTYFRFTLTSFLDKFKFSGSLLYCYFLIFAIF